MIDTKSVLKDINMVSVIEAALGHPQKRSGRWLFWNCPFHPNDDTPSLGITPENGRWFCFACNKGGDAITWLMEYQHISFQEALSMLENKSFSSTLTPSLGRLPSVSQGKPPPDGYQEIWRRIIEECETMLRQPEGERAHNYLHVRGLKDDTIFDPFFRLGYSPGINIQGVWVDRGIIIPCFTATNSLQIEYISYIKIRRPDGNPKYKKLPGGGANLSGLFGSAQILGSDVVFMTEGEFDCMLLHQEAGDLVGVCTLGSASEHINLRRFAKYILPASHIITAYDNDAAGQRGAYALQKESARVHCAWVPTGKDITEFWQSGGDLASWVMDVLKGLNIT